MKANYKHAFADVAQGILGWRIWTRMGWQEIRRRYRRTVLGPFWVTVSLGMFVGAMGFVWAPLFGVSVAEYLPFIATGMVCWVFVSTMITEGCAVYTLAEPLIKQLNFPLSILNWMLVWRNVVVLIHNLAIVALVFLVLQYPVNVNALLFVPGVAIVALNGVWIGMLLGMISARYRDIPQLVGNLVQVAMFVTPIFWFAHQLGGRARIINFNPLYHMIEVVRGPLLGQVPSLLTYSVNVALVIVGWTVTMIVYARFRRRIAFWL